MSKFKNWLNGFEEKEYTVELAEEANLQTLNLSTMGSAMELIVHSLETCPSMGGVEFTLQNFVAEKVSRPKVRSVIRIREAPLQQVVTSKTTLRTDNMTELKTRATLYCIGIDNHIWKFVFYASVMYNSITDVEQRMTGLLLEYLNGWIETLHLNVMSRSKLFFSPIEYFDNMREEVVQTVVRSYTHDSDYQLFGRYGYTPDDDLDTVFDTTSEEIVEKNEDKALVVDVVRQTNSTKVNDPTIDVLTDDVITIEDYLKSPKYKASKHKVRRETR